MQSAPEQTPFLPVKAAKTRWHLNSRCVNNQGATLHSRHDS
jgi:hypothetical protein